MNVTLVFDCIACRRPAMANPQLVKSLRVSFVDGEPQPDPNGKREPICRACAERWFESHNQPIPVAELDQAYNTAANEGDI